MTMKKRLGIILVTTISALWAWQGAADDLFRLYWRGTVYKHDASGHIVSNGFTEQNFVNKVAADNGLNPNDLVFVFRPNKRDTAVVYKSNGGFVSDVIQFGLVNEGYPDTSTDVTSPRGQVIVRSVLLFDENHDLPLGSFFGTEYRTLRSSGGVTGDSLTGTAIYAMPDLDKVYKVHISTGSRVRDTSGG
jgi:hypothetical protein